MRGRCWVRAAGQGFDPDRKIGDLRCAACGSALRAHCELHFLPCCPGKCSGPDWFQRLLGITGRAGHV